MENMTLRLSAVSISELALLHGFFSRLGREANWPDKLTNDLILCCEELLTNTILYGYADRPASQPREILLTVKPEPDRIQIELADNAAPFNPLLVPDPDVSLTLDERPIGGLGVYFVKRIMDELHYESTGRGNRLILQKRMHTMEDGQR